MAIECRFAKRLRRLLTAGALWGGVVFANSGLHAQSPTSPAVSQGPQSSVSYLAYPRFKIPFNVDANRKDLSEVQLWVSTDEGATWQMHGMAKPSERQFEFRAAAEGIYYFSVQTVDQSGNAFPSQSPPLKVFVDTTKPEAAMRADLDQKGQLVVDIRVAEDHLKSQTASLRVRTDRSPEWQAISLEDLVAANDIFETQAILKLPQCREVALVFEVQDQANNTGQATFLYAMPRTAAGEKDMTLASAPSGNQSNLPQLATQQSSTRVPEIPNAKAWNVASEGGANASNQVANTESSKPAVVDLTIPTSRGPGLLTNSSKSTSPAPRDTGAEALSLSPSKVTPNNVTDVAEGAAELQTKAAETAPDKSAISEAFHCKSRAFSLDYSVEALGGSRLSEIELWGSEDGGRTWQQWGTDPDRQSPFDVQVGNDGMFGFRMVIVNENGLVSNRPKDGETADAWINVDTSSPEVKITRALYGEGPEDGMLVIDYKCSDGHITDRPISLSYSEGVDGPWTAIATGLKNTGIYLWRADPEIPAKVFLKLEAADKAGNVGTHKLDVPIDTKGLAPRGRIQGFRPIIKE